MTAFASAFTSEGFVIGADGRQLGKDKKIFSESSQKIFNFKHRHVNVVYAWRGEVPGSPVPIFKAARNTAPSLKRLLIRAMPDGVEEAWRKCSD